jgi:hypothetical protein
MKMEIQVTRTFGTQKRDSAKRKAYHYEGLHLKKPRDLKKIIIT